MDRFRTKKEATEHIRKTINEIGLCDSIKDNYKDFYDLLLDLFKKHPDYPCKTEGMIDVKIIRNKIQKQYYELNMIKEDNTIEDISWRCCLEARKSKIAAAYRSSVVDQILHFRKQSEDICEKCGIDNGKFHVDHIYHFYKLVNDYEKTITTSKPTKFDTLEDNRARFSTEDRDYELAWQLYHKENATLRMLCEQCNLRRSKTSI